MIDTIIFDLDGTLLNTLDDLMDSVNYMLETNGYPLRTYDEIRKFVGNGVRPLIKRSLPPVSETQIDYCLKVFSEYYNINKNNKTKPYDGIWELLKELEQRGYKMAIVSNKYDFAVVQLQKLMFPQIKVAIGERPDLKPKPAPDSVKLALKLLKSDISRAVYVGDSEVDAQTAVNSQLPCVGVTWGFREKEVLINEGVQNIIDKPIQLLEFLDKN